MIIKQKLKPIITLLLAIMIITLLLPLKFANAASGNIDPGSYNIIGLEDKDYKLDIHAVRRNSSFTLDNEKLSFYMLGCDLVSSEGDRMEFKIRSSEYGAKFVFIAPEAGRKSGKLQTKDFYTCANSILRVKSVDKIIYQKQSDGWEIILGQKDIVPQMWLEEKNGHNEKLQFKHDDSNNPFVINLENYTISKKDSFFRMHHVFSPKALVWDIMDDPTITFESKEIMLRTYETRLSQDNTTTGYIYVDRKPSNCIIGNTIRFGSDSDDGANLATITGIDTNDNKIYINRINKVNVNKHEKGTWLRCFSDYSNGQVIDNIYPKVYLEPSVWSMREDEILNLLRELFVFDPTGIMQDISLDLDSEDNFGYHLTNASYSYDGLNFVGGLNGAFDMGIDLNFFGWDAKVGPVHIDYSSMGNSILDQVLRINTYKREAFRFYFNPYILKTYCDWSSTFFFPPDEFPLTFRLYFDKNLELIGGNMRLNLPGNGMPLPGGLLFIDNIGGGFTYPKTFDVGGRLVSYKVKDETPIWSADAEMKLSMDRKYLHIDGKAWLWGKKIRLGKFDATVAWSYYKGKRFKGVEARGEIGVGYKDKVNLIAEVTFKVKRYKSNGRTKKYVGGSGEARIEAYGYTFGGIGVYFNSKRLKATVKVPWFGYKSVVVKYKNITKNISKLSASDSYGIMQLRNVWLTKPQGSYGVASLEDSEGNVIVLMPEAIRIPQPKPYLTLSASQSTAVSNTLNLPDAVAEAAITIDYTGNLENVYVKLPDGSIKQVEIATEDTVEQPGKLYAMDYHLDGETRQMYIQIKNAFAGDYTLSYTAENVTGTAIYEINRVPQIKKDSLNAALNSDNTVDLDWELEQAVAGDVRYHLTMVNIDNGQVVYEYPIYEDLVDEDDDTVTENYIPLQALTVGGTTIRTKVKLNDNLLPGNYAFRVEPVLYRADDDNLYGKTSFSSEIVSSNDFSAFAAAPRELTVDNTGNGVTRVMWQLDGGVYCWNIDIKDTDGATVSSTTLLTSELTPLENIYIDPLSGKQYVYQNIGLGSNTFADVLLQDVEYDTPYTFEVAAVQRVPHLFITGQYYDPINNYIDLNAIEAETNEGDLVYTSSPSSSGGMLVEGEKVNFFIEIYQDGKTEPLFKANAFEGDTGEIDYSYDFDMDTDVEGLRQIDPGALVLRTNAMDSLKLIPDDEIIKLGISILSPSGSEIINLPAVNIHDFTTMGNWECVLAELNQNYAVLTPAQISRLLQIYNSQSLRLEGLNVEVNLSTLVSHSLIEKLEPGRYTICVEAYNENNDLTRSHFEIVMRDINPTVFIENVQKVNSTAYIITGFANGAQTVTLNGIAANVENGIFELKTYINSDSIEFSLIDEFGNSYSGTVDYDEYAPPAKGSPTAEGEEPQNSKTPTPAVAAVSVTGIEFDTDYVMLSMGDQKEINDVCSYALSPSNATDSAVIWHSSNPNVVSISGSTVKANDVGKTTITVTAQGNKYASDIMVIEVVDNATSERVEQTGQLQGQMVNSSGQPLAKYSVTIYSAPVTEITDAAGNFSFASIPYGKHTLVVCDPKGVEIGRFLLAFHYGSETQVNIDNVNKSADLFYTNDTICFEIIIKVVGEPEGIDIVGYDYKVQPVAKKHKILNSDGLSMFELLIIIFIVLVVLFITMAIIIFKKRNSFN